MTEKQLEMYKDLLQRNIDSLKEFYEEEKHERTHGEIKGLERALKHLDYILGLDWLK